MNYLKNPKLEDNNYVFMAFSFIKVIFRSMKWVLTPFFLMRDFFFSIMVIMPKK